MPKIKNKLFQPLAVLLEDEKTLHLQSREQMDVDSKDLESAHLQALMKRGDIALVEEERNTRANPARGTAKGDPGSQIK